MVQSTGRAQKPRVLPWRDGWPRERRPRSVPPRKPARGRGPGMRLQGRTCVSPSTPAGGRRACGAGRGARGVGGAREGGRVRDQQQSTAGQLRSRNVHFNWSKQVSPPIMFPLVPSALPTATIAAPQHPLSSGLPPSKSKVRFQPRPRPRFSRTAPYCRTPWGIESPNPAGPSSRRGRPRPPNPPHVVFIRPVAPTPACRAEVPGCGPPKDELRPRRPART